MPYSPTRLPYGLALAKPWNNQSFSNAQQILLQNSASTLYATPTVYSSFVIAANSGIITNFLPGDNNVIAQMLYIKCTTGGVVVIQNSAPAIRVNNIVYNISAGILKLTSTAGNITMLNGEMLSFLHDGTGWVLTSPRVVDTTMA